ncbi:hypothetical protein WR25_25170 [Diploscapter pachys]|uniref:Uncharacterized protein n=1 Tax=Diploscapter pachys TaxID=2018661 RepID=A0A2A2LVV7_9BILA|nr:hypothetical protein WR25_25170 [Diploscapter pachys]
MQWLEVYCVTGGVESGLAHSVTSSNSPSSMSSTSSSVEHSPIDSATSRHARRKWSSAIKVAQGLYRFKHNLAKNELNLSVLILIHKT